MKGKYTASVKRWLAFALSVLMLWDGTNMTNVSYAATSEEEQSKVELRDVSGNDEDLIGDPAESYSITYELGGGTNSEKNPFTYTEDTPTITLEPASRKGYTFGGWFEERDYIHVVVDIPKGSKGDLVLYARWVANQYTISFQGNNATAGTMTPMSACRYDVSYVLTKNGFTRKGYTFTGWNTQKDGTGTGYYNEERVANLCEENGATITLYAQWEKTKYTITYVLNGGKNSKKNPAFYYPNTKTIKLAAPTRKGYVFNGWYQTKKFKKKITEIKKGSSKNYTLYAKWTPIRYTVVYNGNGATGGSMSTTTTSYDKSFKLRKNAYTRAGFTFAGWNTKKNGTGKNYKNKAKVKNLAYKQNKKVNLYAQWEKVSYTINYHLNGGVNSKKNPTGYTVSTKPIPLYDATKEGYLFAGWYVDEAMTNRITQIDAGAYGNLELYAKWGLENYTVEFDGNGGTGKVDSISCKTGEAFKLPLTGFVRYGYVCTGWNTQKDGTGNRYECLQEVSNLTDEGKVTLYAQWREMTATELGYAAEVVIKVNEARKNANVSTLTEDKTLAAVAQQRSYEIVTSWSHDRANGASYKSLYDSVGLAYTVTGENIANKYTTAANVMNAWMNSASHKAIILSSSYKKIGVGCICIDGTYYWVQNFSD